MPDISLCLSERNINFYKAESLKKKKEKKKVRGLSFIYIIALKATKKWFVSPPINMMKLGKTWLTLASCTSMTRFKRTSDYETICDENTQFIMSCVVFPFILQLFLLFLISVPSLRDALMIGVGNTLS